MIARLPIGRAALASTAMLLALSGCAPQHRFTASWYLVHSPEPSPSSTPALYVALLNHGRHVAEPLRITLNDKASQPFPFAAGLKMRPGELLLLPAPPQPACTGLIQVPVRVFVTLRGRSKAKAVSVQRPMPSALPEEWLNARSTAVGMPPRCPESPAIAQE